MASRLLVLTWQFVEANMKRLMILVLAITVAVGLQQQPAHSADATSAWNAVAASYNFDTTYGAMMGATFAQAYRGTDFNTDFAAILDAVANAMATNPPVHSGGDVMSTSLQNWPDS
jgi:hypothetical protein